MSLSHIPIAVFVLVAGLVALFAVSIGFDQPWVEPVSTPAPVVEDRVATAGGLDPSVQRVLHSTGFAQVLVPGETSQLPPEVARVLIASGKGLAVPTPSGGAG